MVRGYRGRVHGEYKPPGRLPQEQIDHVREVALSGRVWRLTPAILLELCDQLEQERARADNYHRVAEAAEDQLDRR